MVRIEVKGREEMRRKIIELEERSYTIVNLMLFPLPHPACS